MEAQNEKPFVEIKDARDKESFLKEAALALPETMIWTKNQEKVLKTRMCSISLSERLFYFWIPRDLDPKQWTDALEAAGDPLCFFNMPLAKVSLYFQSPFLQVDPAGLQFQIPDTIFKVQRRKHLRVPITEKHSFKIEFEDPVLNGVQMQKKLVDISTGGCAFLVTYEEEPMFFQGMILLRAEIWMQNRKITFSAEVRHARILPPDHRLKGALVGLEFKRIPRADLDYIERFTLDESRNFLRLG